MFSRDNSKNSFKKSVVGHMDHSLAKHEYTSTEFDWYKSVAYSVRDRLMKNWAKTQKSYYDKDVKRVAYLSMEFLMGRHLTNSLINLGLKDECLTALNELGQNFEDIAQIEQDPGLGNGGLGRLAACFLDSMATMDIPAYGYGIRYEYGIFQQKIQNGQQVEDADHWLQFGNVWEVERPEYMYLIKFGGTVQQSQDEDGQMRFDWQHDDGIMALAYDTPIPGYRTETVNTLRLWAAKAVQEFNFSYFNEGDYTRALEQRIQTENLSRVLYPNDNIYEGKKLRFEQQYFFVSATLQDILRRFQSQYSDFALLPEKIAIQLNDTHPTLAVPELLRLLLDEHLLGWDQAWEICQKTFAYTNHTVMPEALEKWPYALFVEILPRHIQLIEEIDRRLKLELMQKYPDQPRMYDQMSVFEHGEHERLVNMANLAIVACHSVNGVAEIHTELLQKEVFPEFATWAPQKFNNKTNGISPRRWLMLANPKLSHLIDSAIGDAWRKDLSKLEALKALATDSSFQEQWGQVKQANKNLLAQHIEQQCLLKIDQYAMFDVQVKRIHEYKRQILNVLHLIHLYQRLKQNPQCVSSKRLAIVAGKAAPGYFMAKLSIHLISAVAEQVNNDPDIEGKLKIVFLPDYGVSLAQKIIPAANLSEQISTAGMEASGTGNMKFALNGALTIGTLDGANVEIARSVGQENLFIFGKTCSEVLDVRNSGYDPKEVYEQNPKLKAVIDAIATNQFAPDLPGVFQPIVDELLASDAFLSLVDFDSYLEAQNAVYELYSANPQQWTEKSILNVAAMGPFSSDRTISQYLADIWV